VLVYLMVRKSTWINNRRQPDPEKARAREWEYRMESQLFRIRHFGVRASEGI